MAQPVPVAMAAPRPLPRWHGRMAPWSGRMARSTSVTRRTTGCASWCAHSGGFAAAVACGLMQREEQGEAMRRVATAVLLMALLAGTTASACNDPHQMDGFKTCADVTKAEEEG